MPLADKIAGARRAALALQLLLMAFMALETLLKPLPAGAMAVLMAVALLPLAAFLPSLRRGDPGRALWLSLLLLPYLCWALLGTFAPGLDGILALLRSVIISACFTALMLLVRWTRQAALASSNGV